MTKEEAAKRLFGGWYISTSGNLCVDEGERDAFCETIGVAVNALRAQQAKLDGSRWEGCANCTMTRSKQARKNLGYQYCEHCGRPLTEEAWAEMERRIGRSNEKADIG